MSVSDVVYAICALTSLLCAFLLTRGYRRSKQALLLWSSVCFIFLALSNVLLVIDLAILPQSRDLSLVRTIPAMLGVAFLIYGLIWEVK